MAAPARPRTASTSTTATLSKLEPREATDALWNLNLLAALRSGDPARLQPFLTELTKLAQQTRRASTSASPSSSSGLGSSSGGRPPTAGQNGSSTSLGKGRPSGEGERPGSAAAGVPKSVEERAAYILHTAIRVASCQTINLLLSHRQISPNALYPPSGAQRTTPLHLAAQLGREDVLRLLLEQEEIDDTLRDGQGRTVPEIAANEKIRKILSDSVQDLNERYLTLLNEYLRLPPNSPPLAGLVQLLKSPRAAQLDLTVQISGTTILHEAARRSHLQIIELSVTRGADIFARDSRGKGVLDVVGGAGREREGVRALLRQYTNRDMSLVAPDGGGEGGRPPDLRGYLSKYANVAKGWSQRYFVLQDGTLSYYRTQADYPTSCRGSIHTSLLTLKTSSSDKLRLELILRPPSTTSASASASSSAAQGGGGGQRWFLRGEHVGEVGRWAQALRRNVEYYAARAAESKRNSLRPTSLAPSVTTGGAAEDSGSAGQVLRKGFHRSLSISRLSGMSGKARSHSGSGSDGPAVASASGGKSKALGRSPSSSVGGSRTGSTTVLPGSSGSGSGLAAGTAGDVHRTASGTSIALTAPSGSGSLRGVPAGSESEVDVSRSGDDDDEADEDEEEKGPPNEDWELTVESLNAQLDALRSALAALPLAGPAQAQQQQRATLLAALAALQGLAKEWQTAQRTREKYYLSELERERQARKLWEESLAGVVGESERMERELVLAGRRLRSMRNLRASLVDTGAGAGGGEIVASPTVASMVDKELPAPPEAGQLTLDLASPATAGEFASPPATAIGAVAPKSASLEDEDDDDDEFFDAIDSGLLPLTLPSPLAKPSSPPSYTSSTALLDPTLYAGYAHPRTKLPIDDDQRPPVSLWAVLKNSIGKDLTKISFPVFFNEPTSMLQRMAEDMEYSECLDAAVRESDSLKRIAFVAAFAASNYSSTIGRIAKPFNPMLSETFEYARLDKQYRYFSEQVSHHPPISACYCEAPDWLYYGEVDAKNKFMGKSFEIRPTGAAFADLKLSPDKVENPAGYPVEEVNGQKKLIEHYSWKKVITNVSGFILGSPTIDHYGDLRVVNHRTGDTCVLTFKPRGWRGKDAYEIKGAVYDARGQLEWEIAGRWSSQLVMRHADSGGELEPDVSVHGPTSPSSQNTSYFLLWRNTPKPPAPFNLTPFAITLNDLPKDPNLLKKWLPITDCRLRPDQRAFEEGRYEEANTLKQEQEEFQRAARRARERGELPPHEPRWFTAEIDEDSGERVWRPKRRDGRVEYWAEREEAGLSGRPWTGVQKIFIDV